MAAYYNENDPKKAAVLRELIKWGLIASGEVDERSIEDVRPDELAGFTQCHFFAGAGIWSYALRLARWPDDRPVWTGSCPCPSFSAAGKGEGFEDARHLWPAWYRLISKCGPATIFGEQVEAAIGYGWIDLVQTDLETQAYAFGKIVLGACSVGAPHIRQRVYFVADSAGGRGWRPSRTWRSERSGGTFVGRESASRRRTQRRSSESLHNAVSDSDSLHAERRTLNEHRQNGRDGQDRGRTEAHLFAGAHGEVCDGSDSNGRDAISEGLQRGGQHGLRAQDGCSTWIERDSERAETSERSDSERGGRYNRRGMYRGRDQEVAGDEATIGSQLRVEAERDGIASDGLRDWRGPGWLDPITARSVAEAGATRGFWADCDWWYGRDGKYRPIGPGLFPLAHGATARVVRLRCYGDGIVAQVAQAFIEAYMSTQATASPQAGFASIK